MKGFSVSVEALGSGSAQDYGQGLRFGVADEGMDRVRG